MSTARVRVKVGQQQGVRPLWFANHETGRVSSSGWYGPFNSGDAWVAIASNPVHSGAYSLELGIDTSGGRSGARLELREVPVDGRSGPLPDEAYYSAWYYLPAGVRADVFWSIGDWKTSYNNPDGSGGSDPMYGIYAYPAQSDPTKYGLRINSKVDQSTGLYVGGGKTLGRSEDAGVLIEPRSWVHIEHFYRWSYQRDGRITTWINGRQVWAIQGVITEYNPRLFGGTPKPLPRRWKINNYSSGLDPARVSLWIDDAVAAFERVYGKTVLGL